MKSLSLFLIFLIFVITPASSGFLEKASIPFTRVDTSVERDEYPIAIPLKGRPLRVLFIGQRDVVGLLSLNIAERLDCSFETVLTESRRLTGVTDFRAGYEADVLSKKSVEKLMGRLFREKWDIIWLDFDFDALPEGLKPAMLDHIRKGAGLMYVGNKRDLGKLGAAGKVDNIQLEAATFGKFEPECIGKLDRGIVVVMPPQDSNCSLMELADYLTSAVNSIMFASGHYTNLVVSKLPRPGKIVEQESIDIMNYRMYLINNHDTRPMKIVTRYRNEQGEVVEESNTLFRVEEGKSFVILEYPFLPMGTYSVDISIIDSDGVIALAGTSFTVTVQNHMTELDFWEMSAPEGGLIIGKLKIASHFTEAMLIHVELLDCRGRLIGRNELVPELKRKEVDFAFKLMHVGKRAMKVQAYLYKSNKLVQKLEKPVFIRKNYDPRRFSLIVADNRALEVSSLERYRILLDAGVEYLAVDMTNLSDMKEVFQAAINAASSGAGIIPRITRIASSAEGNIMEPVITTLEYNENLEDRIRAFVDTLRHISPPAYSLGRDNMLTPFEIDVGFSETDIESFHLYLESKYTTVEELNAAWKTDFTLFEEARPVKLADANRTGAYAAWLDTRFHMEEVFTQVHYGAFEAFNSAETGVLVGIEGFENTRSPFRGYNLFELTGFLTMVVPRQDAGAGLPGDVCISAVLNSFALPGSLKGLSVGGEAYCRGNEALLRAAPWQSLFMGMNSVWWERASGGVEAALTPQNSLSPAFSAVVEEAREIMGGIDLLVGESTRLDDTIGILYSPVSKMAACKSLQSETEFKVQNSMRSFYLACEDVGYTPMFVADDQLTGDWLNEKNFSILILPYVQAMSDETVQCIEKFVRSGGTVLADMRPAVMNEHLFMRGAGALDGIFGVETGFKPVSTPLVSGTFQPQEIEGGIPLEYTFQNCPTDPSVKAVEGVHVMARVDDSPAVIVNRYGDGKGIFLNIGMETYEKKRLDGSEKVLRDIFSWCLFTSGMSPPYCCVCDTTGSLAEKVSITVFRDEINEYIGVLADPLAIIDVYSANEYYLDLSGTGKSYYVYNVRTGKFLGANVHVPIDLVPGKAELFALVPYRVKGLDLKLKGSVVQIGSSLEYTVSVFPQNVQSKLGRHVFRIEVTGSDGSVLPYFSESLEAEKGALKSSLTISPDDSTGRWVLSVKDVISGKKVERAFMVMATGSSLIK